MLSDYHKYRIYEILPGLSIWLSIFLMFFLTFTRPLSLVYFIIIYDIYWVLKVFNFSVYLVIAWVRLKKTKKIDWFAKIKTLDNVECIMHPKDLLDEIPGKGSNMHFAERKMQVYVDGKGWSYENIIVTIFDIDTVCDKYYFSYLTYLYCTNPDPTKTSYQPVALYNNNMWESPAVLRVMAFGTTFWLMTALAQQDSLVTFSSHSMSFRALVDAGFHDKRIVSEDSRIFYQCFLAYNGDYRVTPMYLTVSMDTVRDDNWLKSMKNLYK